MDSIKEDSGKQLLEHTEERVILEEGDHYKVYAEGLRWVYSVELPKLSPTQIRAINEVKEEVITLSDIDSKGLTQKQKRLQAMDYVLSSLNENERLADFFPLSKEDILRVAEILTNEMVGYGMLEFFLKNDAIEEIMVIGRKQPVYVFHSKHGLCETNIVFENEKEIIDIIEKIASSVGRRISFVSPLLDARLRDGSRVNATLCPPSLDGPTITIRKFKKDPYTIIDLINFNTLDSFMGAFLWIVTGGLSIYPGNVLIAGGASSGKTTTLNSLAAFIRRRDRVLVIEDIGELQLPLEHVVRFEARPPSIEEKGEISMDTLLKNSLRMRPDRIIIGEVRGSEAATMFTAMNTGHDGSFGTLHANSAKEVITRLINPPMSVPKIMLPALDLIVIQNRVNHPTLGPIRRIIEVCEVSKFEGDEIKINRVFEYKAKKDEFKNVGKPLSIYDKLEEKTGITENEITKEIENRKVFLEYLIKNDIHTMEQVSQEIQKYYHDPVNLLDFIKK
jgi:flagellar protein FlaI